MSERAIELLREMSRMMADFADELAGRASAARPTEEAPVTEAAPAVPVEVETEPETTEYKLEDVRAALVDARRNRGVNVTELLREFGVENFSAFPAGKYGELMAKLKAG